MKHSPTRLPVLVGRCHNLYASHQSNVERFRCNFNEATTTNCRSLHLTSKIRSTSSTSTVVGLSGEGMSRQYLARNRATHLTHSQGLCFYIRGPCIIQPCSRGPIHLVSTSLGYAIRCGWRPFTRSDTVLPTLKVPVDQHCAPAMMRQDQPKRSGKVQ
jgi:hypothetical protein